MCPDAVKIVVYNSGKKECIICMYRRLSAKLSLSFSVFQWTYEKKENVPNKSNVHLDFCLLLRSVEMCSSKKYPYSPHRRDWNFLECGGFCKAKKIKEMYEA